MNLHEYQSKQLFAQYAVPLPKGRAASSVEPGSAIVKRLVD
jgi:succinyl-CoA synthetase beta subunit